MNTNDKTILENFANRMLAINTTISVPTRSLGDVGYDVDLICRLISNYNELDEEEKKYTFEKGFVMRSDPTSFEIYIKRKGPTSKGNRASEINR